MSNRVKQSGRESLRPLKKTPLMEYRAFAARSFKFAKPDFRPPKLLSKNPRYLYWKTSSRIVFEKGSYAFASFVESQAFSFHCVQGKQIEVIIFREGVNHFLQTTFVS